MRDVVLRRWSVVLVVVAVVLWVLTVALPTWVLVTIAGLPGDDPGRAGRALAIALGWFLTPALSAAAATVGAVVLRRSVRRRQVGAASASSRGASRR